MFTDYMSIDFFFHLIMILLIYIHPWYLIYMICETYSKANEKMIAKYWISFSICIKAIFNVGAFNSHALSGFTIGQCPLYTMAINMYEQYFTKCLNKIIRIK